MEYMDWYFRRQSENLNNPNDQETPHTSSIMSPINEWGLCGSLDPQKFDYLNLYSGTSNKSEFEDFRSFYAQAEERHSREDEGPTSSIVGESSLVSSRGRTQQFSSQIHPDFQLDNEEQMNDIFLDKDILNSFMEDDLKITENTFEPMVTLPDEFRSWPMDPHVLVKEPAKREMPTKECGFSVSEYTMSKDQTEVDACLFPSSLPDDYSKPEDLPAVPMESAFASAKLSALLEGGEDATEDELKSTEASVLQELEDVMTQLNRGMRICFRDAFYRLAKSSRQQHKIYKYSLASFADYASIPNLNCEKSRLKCPNNAEIGTTKLDTTVANLMFTRPFVGPQDLRYPAASAQNCEGNALAFGTSHACEMSSMFPHPQNTNGFHANGSQKQVAYRSFTNEPTETGYSLQLTSYMDMVQ